MIRKQLHSIKTIVALTAFVLFWTMTFVYMLPAKYGKKITPKIAWFYDQLFGQKWNFFTQPNTYNNRLFFVLRDTATHQFIDSVDVLKILWEDKKHNVPFNSKEDILDHISLRQITALRESIYAAQAAVKSLPDTAKKDLIVSSSAIIEGDKSNANTIHNLETFGKLMLEKKHYKINSNTQFKMLLYSDYIVDFKNINESKNCVLEFETIYKFFK